MNSSDKRKLRVFLCHSSKDKAVVRTLYERLKQDGFEPWLDEKNLAPGQNWRYAIEDQVRLSDAFVVCLTKESAKKESFYQKEIKVAFDAADEKPEGTIFIIPVRLEPLEATELPRRLRDTHWANLYEADGYDRLVEALRKRAEAIDVETPTEVISLPLSWLPPPIPEELTNRNAIKGLQRWFVAHRVLVIAVATVVLAGVIAEFYSLYTSRVAQQKEAVRLNLEALARWRVFDLANAYALFGQAVAADGHNAIARANFALSLKERGDDAKAKSEGEEAAASSSHLSQPDRLWVEGVRSEVNSDWKDAAKYYNQLLPLGDKIEAGLRLAEVQTFGGDPRAATATLNQLPPTDARVIFEQAIAANFLGDFAAEITDLNKITDISEPLLGAAALSQRCWAFYKTDQLKAAESDCSKAAALFSDKGDQLGVARNLTRLALVIAHEDPTSKAPMDNLNRALAIARDLHAQRDEAGVLENRANLRMDQSPSPSDVEESRKDYDESASIYSAIGDKRGQASSTNDVATCFEDLCQFENAKASFSKAKSIWEEMGSKDAATATANIGSMLYLLGDLAGAKTALVTALRSAHPSQEDREGWTVTLGEVFKSQGDLARAAECFRGGTCYLDTPPSSVQTLNGKVLPVAVQDFISLRVDEGHPAEVEQLARKEVTRLSGKDSDPDDRAAALTALAQVLLSEGGKLKLQEAEKVVQRANIDAQDCRTRIGLTITSGRILAHSDPRSAQVQLRSAKEQANKLGLLGQNFEAQLALAEADFLAGDLAASRQEASDLENNAHASGFLLVEGKAKDLAKRITTN
jgi:tetratricopeptide (TPR) repeat protein